MVWHSVLFICQGLLQTLKSLNYFSEFYVLTFHCHQQIEFLHIKLSEEDD